MITLGIDTSCDDTAAAVLEGFNTVRSNVVSSQTELHAKFGGIVPEIAARRHIELIGPVVREAISRAGIAKRDIGLVAVTARPGLVGALMVGVGFAKAVAYSLGVPLVDVNHLEGHALAVFLENPDLEFPYLCLLVSGGHTDLMVVRGFGDYSMIGRTRDDAAGEAFDKTAKIIGLAYPGGPEIERASRSGDPDRAPLPKPFRDKTTYDFSFSGIKTAVRNCWSAPEKTCRGEDVAASFQREVVESLIERSTRAMKQYGIPRMAVSGGVAANGYLRSRFNEALVTGQSIYFPSPKFCTDNAAMIALAGAARYANMERAGREWEKISAGNMELDATDRSAIESWKREGGQ